MHGPAVVLIWNCTNSCVWIRRGQLLVILLAILEYLHGRPGRLGRCGTMAATVMETGSIREKPWACYRAIKSVPLTIINLSGPLTKFCSFFHDNMLCCSRFISSRSGRRVLLHEEIAPTRKHGNYVELRDRIYSWLLWDSYTRKSDCEAGRKDMPWIWAEPSKAGRPNQCAQPGLSTHF